MKARVYDIDNNRYYLSEVLGIVNSGYFSKYLVIDDGNLCLIDHLDKSKTGMPYDAKVEMIDFHGSDIWERRTFHMDDDINAGRNMDDKELHFYEVSGYKNIVDNIESLSSLLDGMKIKVSDCPFIKPIPNYDLDGWNYIRKEEDIRHLMDEFADFHDSVLKSMSYESGSYVDDENSMYCNDSVRTVQLLFDSQQADNIEVVFTGLISLTLKPAGENFFSNIYGAYIEIRDELIYFFDDSITSIEESYDGTWIMALEARWRFVEGGH